MPDDEFAAMFGAEYYIEPGRPEPMSRAGPSAPAE